MAEAAILIGGVVIKTTGFSEQLYNTYSGCLAKFKWDNKIYSYCKNADFRYADIDSQFATGGYYEEAKFLEYLAGWIKREDLYNYTLDFSKIKYASNGDRITCRKLKLETPFSKFCFVNEYTWTYHTNDAILDNEANVIVPNDAAVSEVEIPVSGVARDFYERTIETMDSLPANLHASCAYVISLTAIKIDRIRKDIFGILNQDEDFNVYIQTQEFEWSSAKIFSSPSLEAYQSYYTNLTNFYQNAYSNQLYLKNAPKGEKFYYLASVLSPSGLSIIPVWDKIELLKTICLGNIVGAISSIFGAVDEEELAVNVVKSVPDSQVNTFLQGLLTSHVLDIGANKTLFEVLYQNIDDEGIGADNMKAFVQGIYKLWFISDYNPYNFDGSLKRNLANLNNYASAPVTLDYEADSLLWIFNTSNYDFQFRQSKIEVVEPVTVTEGDAASTDYNLIGRYGIYQTVTISHTSASTGETNFLSVEVDGVQNDAVPLFYLKFLDDKKATENLKTALKISVDLALTFSGIGNLAKLRYIRYLLPWGTMALGEAVGTELITYELYQGTAGLIEISASAVDLVSNYIVNYESTYCDVSSSQYNLDKCNFYRQLADFSMLLQLASGVIDYNYSKKLETSARRLLESPLPNDLHPDVLNLVRKFAGDINEIKEIFRVRLSQQFGDNSHIWQKINGAAAGSSITPLASHKVEMFLLDFERSKSATLAALNADDGDLIDYWSEITKDLQGRRTDIAFLRDYRTIVTHPRLTTHIHVGHSGINKKGGAWVTGGHNSQLLLPDSNGIVRWRWVDPNSVIEENGYRYGKVERNMSDKGWMGGKPPSPWKLKEKETTFWPENFDEKRINQEMANGFNNKKFIQDETDRNGVIRSIYRGRASDGQPIEIITNKVTGDIISIFPIIKKIK